MYMPQPADYAPVLNFTTATIASSGTVSAAVDLAGTSLVGIQLPAAFTGTSLGFQAATSLAGTYQAVIDGSGAALTKNISQGKYLLLDPTEFAGIQYLKVVSGSTEASARDLILVTRVL